MSDGEDVRDLVPDEENIRLIHIEDGRTIGEKRNFGCEHAQGEVIAHWDDDDYSAPTRLSDQLERLRVYNLAVTGYNAMYFTDGEVWWRYASSAVLIGTSLCYSKSWWGSHRFPAKQVGEDGAFVEEARQHKQTIGVDARFLMYATIHPGNTSPRQLGHGQWRKMPAEFRFE